MNRPLFCWKASGNGDSQWFTLDHVVTVAWSAGTAHQLTVHLSSGAVLRTQDPEIIARFWDCWERVR